jgi:hypothetical protein
VAPLRLGGRRGKQSTPRVWLGGTGERSTVGKRKRQGARDAARSAGRLPTRARQRYVDSLKWLGCNSGLCNFNDGAKSNF